MTMTRKKLEALPNITPARFAEMQHRAAQAIDCSDIPELDDAFWATAAAAAPKDSKVPVALRLKPEVLDWFRSQGEGYTSRMATILQRFYEHHHRVS
jgi:uncharacterized protein (DUF4415 family)